MRLERQCSTAAALVNWLSGAEARAAGVRRVWHPSLPDHPGHAVALRQMSGGLGAVLSFELESSARAQALPFRTKLVSGATSLGGVESMIEYRAVYDKKVSDKLLRLSVGLEDLADLIADLRAALLAAV